MTPKIGIVCYVYLFPLFVLSIVNTVSHTGSEDDACSEVNASLAPAEETDDEDSLLAGLEYVSNTEDGDDEVAGKSINMFHFYQASVHFFYDVCLVFFRLVDNVISHSGNGDEEASHCDEDPWPRRKLFAERGHEVAASQFPHDRHPPRQLRKRKATSVLTDEDEDDAVSVHGSCLSLLSPVFHDFCE